MRGEVREQGRTLVWRVSFLRDDLIRVLVISDSAIKKEEPLGSSFKLNVN